MADAHLIHVTKPFALAPTVLAHGWWECQPFYYHPPEARLYRCQRDTTGAVFVWSACEPHGTPESEDALLRIDTAPAGFEARARETVFRVLNLHWNLQPLYALCRTSPLLRDIALRGAGRIMRGGNLYEDLLKAVSFTNMRWPQAVRVINRLVETYADPGEACIAENGARLLPFPDAERIARGGIAALTACGLGYRAAWILRLAEGVAKESIALPDPGLCDETAFIAALRRIDGVGPATAGYLANLYGFWSTVSVDSSVVAHVKRHHPRVNPVKRDIQRYYSERYNRYAALAVFMEMAVALGRWE